MGILIFLRRLLYIEMPLDFRPYSKQCSVPRRNTKQNKKGDSKFVMKVLERKVMTDIKSSPLGKKTVISHMTFPNVFHEWKLNSCDSNFFEVCSKGSNQWYSSIDSDNGLVPTRRQAIIWTNADPVHRRLYGAQGGDELTKI